MGITRDNAGFLVWDDAWRTPSLGLETDHLQRCIHEIHTRGLLGAFGRFPEFTNTDLQCLTELPHLHALQLWDIKLKDISGLYGLTNLQSLRLSGKRPAIDFNLLNSLEALVLEHHKKDVALDRLASLTMLNLWRYKARDPNQYILVMPPALQKLRLFFTNVPDLSGFGICPNVTHLEIARSRNLHTLGRLRDTFPRLEHLVVDGCGRLTLDEAERALVGHPTIQHAYAGKRVLNVDALR